MQRAVTVEELFEALRRYEPTDPVYVIDPEGEPVPLVAVIRSKRHRTPELHADYNDDDDDGIW